MLTRESLYEALLRGLRPALALASPLHPKLRRGVEGRAGAVVALERWAAAERDLSRPLVWVHAPSVGEGLMAQAIVSALRERRPELQFAFTYFSPSAERVASRVGAEVSHYLPWDLGAEMRRALAALRPEVIAFVRTEIWPVLCREARRTGVRLALVNAALAEGSSRLRPTSRYLLGPGYARLDRVGAVSPADARRFPRLGIPRERVRVTGDARFDQVWARVRALEGERARGERAFLSRLHDPHVLTVVAGSTWPEDEARLIPAFAELQREERLRLVIAPHEPTPAHLEGLERALDAAGLRHARLGAIEASVGVLPDVVVVDRVGVLADLYALAALAYVGGGFGGAGLHSVVEPAAMGVPVLFGPRFGNAQEAGELARTGGGVVVRSEEQVARALRQLVRERVARAEASAAALTFVRGRLGGAINNAELIEELLDRRGGAER